MENVDSSMMSKLGWEDEVLQIQFKNGKVYHYYEVPEEVYHEMKTSTSIGKFFHQNIKEMYSCDLME